MRPTEHTERDRYQFSWFDGLTVALAAAILGNHPARYRSTVADAIHAAIWQTRQV